MKKLFFALLLIVFAINSCKKDPGPAPADTTTPTADQDARDYYYTVMNQYYFWYNLMPKINKDDYNDPYQLLEAMRYKKLDRWSFLQTLAEYQAMSSGSFVGHGISMALDPANNVRIAQIYNKSPLYALGVRRGWIVKKLNNTDLAPVFIANDANAYTQLIGPSTAAVTNTFLFQTPQGKDSTIVSKKASFTLNTVLVADTLHLKSGITGHLVFDQFITPSNDELQTAFAFFQLNGVKDLIVDLRYNGGGDLSVLTNMASYVAGASKANTPFLTLTFNDKNSSNNQTYKFNTSPYPLTLGKVIVITTRSTASASEDFINGLKPILDVKTIGDTTNGKPVGMVGFQYKTAYMLWPISFSLVNSTNDGEFYNGIAPIKEVKDDITHDWVDRNESCLKEAIYYMEHGTISSKSMSVDQFQRNTIKFTEKSNKPDNAYIIQQEK